jgi:hypothetical protein
MGYDQEMLLDDLSSVRPSLRGIGRDAVRAALGPGRRRMRYLAQAWTLSD